MKVETATVTIESGTLATVSWTGVNGWYSQVFIDGNPAFAGRQLLSGTSKSLTVSVPAAEPFSVEVHEVQSLAVPIYPVNKIMTRPSVTFTKSLILPVYYIVYIDGRRQVIVTEDGTDIYLIQLRKDLARGWHTMKVTAVGNDGAETDHDEKAFWTNGYIDLVQTCDFDGTAGNFTATIGF